MNNCSNSKCRIDLYKHNLFCYKCGSKATNPKKNNNGRLFMKRLTHLYCHSCYNCVESYSDEFCRNCSIRLLSYKKSNTLFSPKPEIKKEIFKIKKHKIKNEKKNTNKNEIANEF